MTIDGRAKEPNVTDNYESPPKHIYIAVASQLVKSLKNIPPTNSHPYYPNGRVHENIPIFDKRTKI